ncbi:hypothetical protein AMAG_08369 [Allomyces macrogynus ATCC 38327]|uniref:NAD(P)-binding domain-containing protein n=1 Tax=Allomyces macrogynus (strain ATCC 38327) TaxID=578462 RepID=A0A0L0SLF9_ALLM3|nr:hypothetical protein AMAG_08369 [Allomyces macrogynus ATCC 38327]|eukprot:KNE63220.1 hypothetical protein AMAG_08369 [Allomyces macrogynus ATCC 38327]
MTQHTVLVVGGTGRVGKLTIKALLARGVAVRAIVRSVPADFPTKDANLQVIQASIVELTVAQLAEHLRGCDTMLCTLGHPRNAGSMRTPALLVTDTVKKLCAAAADIKPATPIRLVLLSSHIGPVIDGDAKRPLGERAALCMFNLVMAHFKDAQACADFLSGGTHEGVEYAAVRPANFVEGAAEPYQVLEHRRAEFGMMGSTVTVSMASVAEFLATLVTDDAAFLQWRGKFPVMCDPKTMKGLAGQ